MVFGHCQELTGIWVKSTNNNNNNNNNTVLSYIDNLKSKFFPFATEWRWCVMN